MKKSAGVILYKVEADIPYILLAHFGGPYWEGIDNGAWSLQKGLVEKNESVKDAAIREVFEETNLNINKDIKYFASKKIAKKKLCIMFITKFNGSIDDFKSNTFDLEWPKNSGNICKFPEMDEIRWFSLEEAYLKINKTQKFFIERLKQKLLNENKR